MSADFSMAGLAVSFVAGGGIGVGAAALLCISPRTQFWGHAIVRGPVNDRRQIALTFDDGPDGEWTPRILDTLDQFDARCVFFVIGRNVQRYPRVLRRIIEEGHVVGNHTWDHDHHGYLGGRRYWEAQLDRTGDVIEQIIGSRPALFRPPMGVKTGHLMRAAAARGQAVITWSRRGMDGVSTTSAAIEAKLGPKAMPGEIIVLHDGVEPNSRRTPAATAAAMEPILRQWRERSLNIVRLDRLLDRQAYVAETAGEKLHL